MIPRSNRSAPEAMSWFDKLMPSRIRTEKRKHSVPEGLWVKCVGCSAQLYRAELHRNLHVCPKCGHHLRISARERLEMFLDPEAGYELAADLEPRDPLRFKDTKRYRERIALAQRETDERDALIVMAGTLKSMPIVAAAFEFRFTRGSMGSVVGERFVRGVDTASNIAGRSCASPRAAARACRKGCTRCCRWPRRARRSRARGRASCRTFP